MNILKRLFSTASKSAHAHATYGPSPWYISGVTMAIDQANAVWREPGSDPPFVSTLALYDAGDRPLIVIGMYVYFRLLDERRIVFWYGEIRRPGQRPGNVVLTLYDFSNAEPLSDLHSACADTLENRAVIGAAAEPLHQYELPLTLSAGSHRIDMPAWLAGETELLILANAYLDEGFHRRFMCHLAARPCGWRARGHSAGLVQ